MDREMDFSGILPEGVGEKLYVDILFCPVAVGGGIARVVPVDGVEGVQDPGHGRRLEACLPGAVEVFFSSLDCRAQVSLTTIVDEHHVQFSPVDIASFRTGLSSVLIPAGNMPYIRIDPVKIFKESLGFV